MCKDKKHYLFWYKNCITRENEWTLILSFLPEYDRTYLNMYFVLGTFTHRLHLQLTVHNSTFLPILQIF